MSKENRPNKNVHILKKSLPVIFIILFVIHYFTFLNEEELMVFPNSLEIVPTFYNDSINNGNSIIVSHSFTNGVISMKCKYYKGEIAPYAGMGFYFKNKSKIDVSKYNRVAIEMSGKNIKDMLLYLITKDSDVKDTNNRLAKRHSYHYFILDDHDQRKEIVLNLKNFATSDWWYTAVGQSRNDFGPIQLDKLNSIAISNGVNPPLDKEVVLNLYSVVFYRDNTIPILIYAFIEAIVIFSIFLPVFRKKSVKNVKYLALKTDEIPDENIDFILYINQNYHNSELTLEGLAKHYNINPRKIADKITDSYDCNFKTYLNNIRIEEAKRLLKETQLNINEIAYKVGYSSPNSFNRVFKSFVGITPTEYKNSDQ